MTDSQVGVRPAAHPSMPIKWAGSFSSARGQPVCSSRESKSGSFRHSRENGNPSSPRLVRHSHVEQCDAFRHSRAHLPTRWRGIHPYADRAHPIPRAGDKPPRYKDQTPCSRHCHANSTTASVIPVKTGIHLLPASHVPTRRKTFNQKNAPAEALRYTRPRLREPCSTLRSE